MEATLSESRARGPLTGALDLRGAVTWAVSAAVVLYLGLNGGGYDTTIWGSVGVIVWWVLALGAIVALNDFRRPSLAGWLALGALAAFAAWSAIGMIWTASDERTLTEVARVATYLGVLALTIGAVRTMHARQLVAGIATGIVVIAVIALLSRLRPGWFAPSLTNALLPGARSRLSYPLNYWNALGELVAIGIPLVLGLAAQARTILRQAVVSAALPVLVLTLMLTLARGGLIALAVGLLALLVISGQRVYLIATAILAGGGGAILTVAAFERHDFRDGLGTALARHQGGEMLLLVVIVCAAVIVVQLGLGFARERGAFAHVWSSTQIRGARILRPRLALGALVIVAAVAFAAVGGPHRLSHAWTAFKRPTVAQNGDPARLGSLSGNGRYQFWRSSVKAVEGHPLRGIGAGTWEFWWTRHGSGASYAQNAHSLLFESLAETGIPGAAMIFVLLGVIVIASAWRALRKPMAARAPFAAAAAACVVFGIATATDWTWQVPVVPICFMALAALALGRDHELPASGARTIGTRLGVIVAAVACLASIVIPLATTSAVRESQAAVRRGSIGQALQYARSAERLEPYAATPWLQQAVVLELAGTLAGAAAAGRRAEVNEPANWRLPLILARIDAERGHTSAALADARRALVLNPSVAQYLR